MAATLDAAVPAAPPRRTLAALVERENRRRRRRRAALSATAVALVVAIAGVAIALRPRPLPFPARFRTAVASRGDVVREVRATGHVEAVTTVQVGAEISGRVASVEVDFDDRVKAGQVLARFDRAALQAQLAQTEAVRAAALAALEQAKTDRDRAALDEGRVERLHAQKSVSDADRDAAAVARRLAEQRVAAAEAQLAAQNAALTLARTNLEHAVIRAPIDGVVITRNVDPGQTVASVFATPVLFTVAADLRKMRVVAAVDEAEIGEVARGQRATFAVNAYPDRTFEGIVTEVRSSPQVVQEVVTYGAVVEVDNLDFALKPGMTAAVRIRTASASGVLRVPASALRFAPPGEPQPTRDGVWILDGASLRRVAARAGVSDGETTEVAATSLAEGSSVAVELSPEGRKAYGIGR